MALLALVLCSTAAHADICPGLGADTLGCSLVITVTAVNGSGLATAFNVTAGLANAQGPYDGVEDTLIGVTNSSGAALLTLHLIGNDTADGGVFAFEADGACSAYQSLLTCDTTGYAPTGITFANLAAANGGLNAGDVKFSPGLANGSSYWFSLEGPLSTTSIVNSNNVPEPGTLGLLGSGMGLLGLLVATGRRKLRV
jgi:hypothetical protein